ncbi:MAG: chemotaxis protein CheY [Alphaproteobacteria bacterium]|nr:chemotaxis protein CheY [Alphaproteobacteria bacterium]
MGQACVYIVDDDDNIRRSTTFLLSSHELGCRAFATGEDLLDAIDDLDPGCILLDIVMPQHSGLEVQAELRRRGSKLPVIAMTGGGDEEMAIRSLEMGAIDILEKPFAEEALLAALQRGFDQLDRVV